MRIVKEWFKGLSNTGKIVAVSTVAVLSIGGMNALAQPNASQEISDTKSSQSVKQIHTPKVEKRTVTATEPVKFSSSIIDDSNIDSGVTQTRVGGVDGVKTHYFDVTYVDGVETQREEVKSEITTPVVNEVIAKGTKVMPLPQAPVSSCPNGTYVNTYGNTVCSPAYSTTAPSGASAQCVDGTYSYSQSRRGTCSHHGGVASWL